MQAKNMKNFIVFIFALTAVLVLVNLIGLNAFFRVDLTRDGKYTLSPVSEKTVQNIDDKVTVSAYFSDGLPPPYSQNARYVKDLLTEYYSASPDHFAFEFVDPMSFETSDDKEKKKNVQQNIFGQLIREPTAVEKELAEYGVQPVEIRVIENDQQQTKRAYMAIVVRYKDKFETIPYTQVVQGLEDLEINITSIIKNLTREKRPVVGAIIGETVSSRIKDFLAMLEESGEVKKINLQEEEISDDIEALWVLGNGDHFGEEGASKIQAFLAKGKSASFFMDIFNIQPQSFVAIAEDPRSSGYSVLDLLKNDYGIEVTTNLVADANCASINIPQQIGGLRFNAPSKYPFIPEVRNLAFDSQISKGLTGLILPFVSELIIDEKPEITTNILASSSKVSWLEKDPLNLDPKRKWGQDDISQDGPFPLVVEATAASGEEKSLQTRIVVAGSSALFWNEFFTPANKALAQNIFDWMVADTDLLSMRSKTFTEVPLDSDVSDFTRNFVKYFNVIGVPLLLILYGVIRWRLREASRKSLKI